MRLFIITLLLMLCTTQVRVRADTYVYADESGQRVTIEARSIGSGRGFEALQRRDGQIQIVPTGAILDRKVSDGPQPLNREQMVEMLTERFGDDLIRIEQQGNFIVGLVLSAPIEQSAESRASTFITKATRFMNRVDEVFLRYAKSRKFPLHEPEFPLVLLIYESDDEFNKYAAEATGGSGLSAENIAGFYSPITNWLAVRMTSCDSFEVPLHEAIHLEMYNRVFQRLAPIPKWFDEGIATGFEGDGDRINVSPAKISPRYATQFLELTGRVDWNSVVTNDGAFTADILAGEAYTLAWCMHWLLANHHKEDYEKYVEELAQRKPLEELAADERQDRFDAAFTSSVSKLQSEFPDALRFSLRRQKVKFEKPRTDGISSTMQGLGKADLQVIATSVGLSRLAAAGKVKNMSPLRSMTLYVTVETAEGRYAEWLAPDLNAGKQISLKRKNVDRRFANSANMPAGSYRVFIRSAMAGSEESENWKSGIVPGPFLAR